VLTGVCAREAPHVVLEFTWLPTRNAEDLALVDFMIGPRAFGQTLGKRLGSLPLWRDEMVCVASAANRAVPARLTPAQFQAMRYVAFRRGLHVPQDVQIQIQPTSPLEVAPVCTVPNFLVLGAIVAQSDCVALVPRKVARALDPAVEPGPAAARGLDPLPAGFELGGEQIEGDHEEDPALQDRQQAAHHRHDQAGDDRDGHQRLAHGEKALRLSFASLTPLRATGSYR
jgi:DNA-binding transcriptional LysR family regulator